MKFPELEKGPIPAEVELRWTGEMRDWLRRCTFGAISKDIQLTKGVTEVELHVYYRFEWCPSDDLVKAIRSAIRSYVKWATKRYIVQRVEIFPESRLIHLLVFRRKEKLKSARRRPKR